MLLDYSEMQIYKALILNTPDKLDYMLEDICKV